MNAVDPQPMMNVRLNLEEGMDVKDKVTHQWENIMIVHTRL